MERIHVSGPWITKREIDYVTDAVTNAWYDNAGTYNARFEEAFAAYTERKYAISLPSCTSALHLSLLSLGVGLGDEVIVPDCTWIATAAPITYVGATPVFADVDLESWCIDPVSLEECITPRTKAAVVVNLYGNMPDMDAIMDLARRNNIAIIEDAAEAIGSRYKARKAGGFGDTSVFSFHGSKTVTTGEGGMLVTDSEAINARALFLRDHGRKPGDKMFYNSEVAYKYKMSSMQAALGLAQLERVDELIARKREIFAWYTAALGDIGEVTLNFEAPTTVNTYWMVTAIVDRKLGKSKEVMMERLSERGIDTRPFFHPLSSIPAFAKTQEAERARKCNRISYQISPYGINLPSGFNLTEKTVEYVCDSLRSVLREQG